MRPLPFDLEDLRALVSVVDAGGFARAAQRLGSSKSVLSRRVAALEQALGAQLLVREQRGTRLTEAGAELHHTAAEVLARLERVRDDAMAGLTEITGPVRITAPLSFGAVHLAPALAAFAAAHPGVELDVRLDDHVVDLLGGGFDLGLRIGRKPDAALDARRLATVRPYVVGSPGYFSRRGRPAVPRDLIGHDVLDYTNSDMDLWRATFGPPVAISRLNVRFRSDNGETLRSAAIKGLGLVILPNFIIVDAVERGELEPVLTDHPFAEAGLYAVSPPRRPRLRRVRALIEHLASTFGPEPPWDFPAA